MLLWLQTSPPCEGEHDDSSDSDGEAVMMPSDLSHLEPSDDSVDSNTQQPEEYDDEPSGCEGSGDESTAVDAFTAGISIVKDVLATTTTPSVIAQCIRQVQVNAALPIEGSLSPWLLFQCTFVCDNHLNYSTCPDRVRLYYKGAFGNALMTQCAQAHSLETLKLLMADVASNREKSARFQSVLLSCLEEHVTTMTPKLLPVTPVVLKCWYDGGVVCDDEVVLAWYGRCTHQGMRTAAEPFIAWLNSAEDDSDDDVVE